MKYTALQNCSPILLALALTTSVEGMAGNNQYNWQGSNGVTVYSDQLALNADRYKTVSIADVLESTSSGSRSSREYLETAALEDNSDTPSQGTSSESGEGDNEDHSQLCKSAQMKLIALESNRELNIRNEKGEVRRLSQDEREISKQNAKAQITTYCEK